MDCLHHAVRGRGDGVLHLHRLEDEQRLPLLYRLAGPRHDLDDLPGHGRGERAAASSLVLAGQAEPEREAAVVACGEDMPIVSVAERARAIHAAIEADGKRSVLERLSRERMLLAVHREPQPASAEVHPDGMLALPLDEEEVVV